jgi:chromosome segregation ATPase
MYKVAIASVVVIIAAAVVFGGEKLWSYARGGSAVLNHQLDTSTPTALEVARIRVLIDSQGQKIQKYDETLLDLQSRADAAARNIEALDNRLGGERQLLQQVKSMLDRGESVYLIGTRQYTREQVNTDALARLEQCKQMQEELAFQSALKGDLDAAIDQGRRNMADARRQHGQLTNQLARLEARDANADVRAEIAALTGAVQGAPVGQSSELERAFLNLERRVALKERRILAAGGNVQAAMLIDYSATHLPDDAAA